MPELEHFGDVSYIKQTNTNMGAHIDVYLYLVDGLLIDCGPQIMEQELGSFFRTQPIEKLAVTHLHEDHCGMAAWVQQNLGVPICLDSQDITEADAEGEYAQYRHLTWGDRPGFLALPLPPVLTTHKYSFQIFNTPGHMARHSVLLEKNKGWLFSGDLYVRSKIRFCAQGENMKEYIKSLENILAHDFDTVFCAHAGVLENGREKLRQKLDFMLELQEKVNVLRRQGLSNREIDHELFPDEQIITLVSDGEWNSYNIVSTI